MDKYICNKCNNTFEHIDAKICPFCRADDIIIKGGTNIVNLDVTASITFENNEQREAIKEKIKELIVELGGISTNIRENGITHAPF